MRVLLVNGMPNRASVTAFDRIGAYLNQHGVATEVVHDVSSGWPDPVPFDLLASHVAIPRRIQGQVRCLTRPRHLARPVGMRMLQEAGIPTMDWTVAESPRQVDGLFDRWAGDRLLLKRSWGYGGKRVTVFDRASVGGLEWDRHDDIFCPEVNPADGDVYKAELYNGAPIISWKSNSPCLSELHQGGVLTGIRGVYGRRQLLDAFPLTEAQIAALATLIRERRLGMCSIDFMARPDGGLVAIEVNTRNIATWWTPRFPFYAERYAAALHAAIEAGDGDPPATDPAAALRPSP